jgi:ubiquitin carboxyl-terminal hydrolase L3
MATKTWKMLGKKTPLPITPPIYNPNTDHKPTENNPEVMNALATKLGLSPSLEFHDVYSLDSQAELAHIPRPALALLVIIPLTTSWARNRETEDADKGSYTGCGNNEPVIWFKQTIGHACGSIGLLHSVINGPAVELIIPDSDLDKIRKAAIPLQMDRRAEMLHNNTAFETAHESVEQQGDSYTDEEVKREGGHFVSFVKSGGKLWELEGNRKGPLDRGALEEDEDVLSPRALEMGIKRIIEMSKGEEGEDLLFSCIALARKAE